MDDTDRVARFVVSTTPGDLPADVVDAAKTHVRDTLGVALAGATRDVGEIALDYVAANNPGAGATVVGDGTATPVGAAFANGVLAHALEWDDTPAGPHHLSHPSAPTLPAALAAAELADAAGPETLAGYVTGVEVLSRLELASFPEHYYHGWHDTGTYGVFGACAAASSILGLDREATTHALGVAASSSAGLRKNNGTMTKPFHAGHAASDGLRAALLAREGFTAHPEILEGEIGFGAVYSPGGYDASTLDTFGDEWHLLDYGYKPFPGITFCHAAQMGLLELVDREDLAPDDVAEVTVQLADRAYETLPNDDPTDPFAAIASIEFAVATILRERGHGLAQFSADYVTAPETRAQMAKVEREVGFAPDDDLDMFGARLRVETTDGREFLIERPYSPAEVTDERLTAKFYDCATTVLDRGTAERLDEAVSGLADGDGALDALLGALGPVSDA
jgi:2-methylcitrate dehydratase PrpD